MDPKKINIKVKLRAYTRGIIPNSDLFLTDAPIDGRIYGREDGEWVDITEGMINTVVAVGENSGLDVTHDPISHTYTLNIRKEDIKQVDLPEELAYDTTYYVLDQTANTYLNGGTCFSDGNNDYITESEYYNRISGGAAELVTPLIIYGTNSRGVCNE